jgi:hypothetical protein
METTYSFRWGYYIKVYDTGYSTGKVIEFMKWENLTFELFCKYKWYFEYRYALFRVRYPKSLINHENFKRDLNEKETIDFLKNKIIGKKRTITKYKNKLSIYESNWNSLFSISDDEPYKKAVHKISRLEEELNELKNS